MDAKRAGKTTIKMAASLVKHYAKAVLGEDALGIIANAWTDAAGDSLGAKLESWLEEEERNKELLDAVHRADESVDRPLNTTHKRRDSRRVVCKRDHMRASI